MVRGQGVTTVLLLSVLMLTTAIVGLAVLRTVRPLVTRQEDRTPMIGDRTRAALEREKTLALRTLKELEFDRSMRKISEEDYSEMSARLRARATRIIRQLDAGAGHRAKIEADLAKRLGEKDSRRHESRAPRPRPAPRARRSTRRTRSSARAAGSNCDEDAQGTQRTQSARRRGAREGSSASASSACSASSASSSAQSPPRWTSSRLRESRGLSTISRPGRSRSA